MKKETKNEKSMFKMSIIKQAIIALLFMLVVSFTLSFAINSNVYANVKPIKIEDSTNVLNGNHIEKESQTISIHDSIRLKMIEEVDRYINKITRGKHDKRLPEYLVDNSIEHNIDLCFMMSQTQIETAFGTTGAGKPSSRKSLFGIVKKRWSNYNDAIDAYCKLLKKSYLVNGRTEHDLMRKYVNRSGYRYAGLLTYEREMQKTYREICKKTNLDKLQKSYRHAYSLSIEADSLDKD